MQIVFHMAAHRIIEFREARGWTQEDLGTRIGRTKWQISRLESGKTRLDMDTAHKLAHILGVALLELVGGDASPATAPPGLAEEAAPYEPPSGDPMSGFLTKARQLSVVNCGSLDKIGFAPGDILVVDYSPSAVDAVVDLAAVLVRFRPREIATKPITLLRQFVPPRLLITNSAGTNHPSIDMDKEDAQIVGVVVSHHRTLR
jgi:transcriptional regulator with XRE-family HTH domain